MQCSSAAATYTRGLCCQTLFSSSTAAAHITAVPKRAAYSAPLHFPVLCPTQTKRLINNWSAVTCSEFNVARKSLAEQHALQEAVLWSRTPSSNRKAPIPNQAYYCLLGHLYAAARLELMRMGETLHLSQYTPAGPVHGNVSPVIQCSCADWHPAAAPGVPALAYPTVTAWASKCLSRAQQQQHICTGPIWAVASESSCYGCCRVDVLTGSHA